MRRILAVALVILCAACLGKLEPLPFQVAITASKTIAAVGDTVYFSVNATGGRLLGVQMDYADGSTEDYNTGGAQRANVSFKHVFQTIGSFLVVATVGDDPGGIKGAAITIDVN